MDEVVSIYICDKYRMRNVKKLTYMPKFMLTINDYLLF